MQAIALLYKYGRRRCILSEWFGTSAPILMEKCFLKDILIEKREYTAAAFYSTAVIIDFILLWQAISSFSECIVISEAFVVRIFKSGWNPTSL